MKKSFLVAAAFGIFVLSSFTSNSNLLAENTERDDSCTITKTWSTNGVVTRSITISGSPCSEVIERINAVQ